VSGLHAYAVVARAPARLGAGLASERLRAVVIGRLVVIAGELRAPPPLTARSLRGHDDVVRRVSERADAVLPCRFGPLLEDERALAAALAPREAELLAAVERVRGCEQMTVRVFDGARRPRAARPTAVRGGEGAGARYLASRARVLAREIGAVDALHAALSPIARDEAVETHDKPPLLATLHHLVARGAGEAYRAAILGAPLAAGLRAAVAGPAPPYAFSSGVS
jgi:hypothetical protein